VVEPVNWYAIGRLDASASPADVNALAALLVDVVRAGFAVSFLDTLTHDEAVGFWKKMLTDRRVVVLVARDGKEIVGTVQMHPAWAPNQPHRAEIVKLMVSEQARGQGLGVRLMDAIENEARDAGFTLLTLDAKAGGGAEALYRKLGWTAIGAIPRYAIDPDGATPHAAVFFYKELSSG
jgi:ribosomal protein S18 acetylase RimI-like enzyme